MRLNVPAKARYCEAEPTGSGSTASAPAPTAVAATPRGEQTASALLDSALSAMLAKQSVHLACTMPTKTGAYVESIDVGTASGRVASTEGDVSITNMRAAWAQGVSVYGVSGGAPSSGGPPGATKSVYIAAAGAPLPASVTEHSNTGTATCEFSGWNEPLHLTAPANVIPITSIPA
jgi:hypothetical protein